MVIVHLIIQLCFIFSNTLRGHCFMVSISLPTLHLNFMPIQMQIRQVTLLITDPPLTIVSFLVILLCLYKKRIKQLLLDSIKKMSIRPLLIQNFFGFVDYLKTWVSFILLQLSSTVIIKVLSRSLTIMNSMNAQNTLKLIVSLCNNILPLRLLDYSQFHLLIRLLISSPRHVHMNAFKIQFSNLSWSLFYHFEFEGGC